MVRHLSAHLHITGQLNIFEGLSGFFMPQTGACSEYQQQRFIYFSGSLFFVFKKNIWEKLEWNSCLLNSRAFSIDDEKPPLVTKNAINSKWI